MTWHASPHGLYAALNSLPASSNWYIADFQSTLTLQEFATGMTENPPKPFASALSDTPKTWQDVLIALAVAEKGHPVWIRIDGPMWTLRLVSHGTVVIEIQTASISMSKAIASLHFKNGGDAATITALMPMLETVFNVGLESVHGYGVLENSNVLGQLRDLCKTALSAQIDNALQLEKLYRELLTLKPIFGDWSIGDHEWIPMPLGWSNQ